MTFSKSYCPMPFVTLTVNPGNFISRCMMSWIKMGTIEKETYSNENFQTLRKNMLEDKWDTVGCHTCYLKEQNGMSSQRTKWLNREEMYLGETGIYESNLSIERNKIYHLYMNFSNICNFKCRMCGPHFSNAWIPDFKKMNSEASHGSITPKQQVDVDKFLNEFGPELSNLRQIWITGGEPFMDDSVYRFFDNLEEFCELGNISVTINTNGSKVDIEKLSLLDKLKKLHINVSVDSTHEYYSYMRGYNFTFEQLDSTMRKLTELKQTQENLLVTVNGAFQLYNILNITDFFDWGNDVLNRYDAGWIEHRVLTGPAKLQARHAPDSLKKQSIAQVEKLIERFPRQFYLPDILKELHKSADKDEIKQFVEWTDKLDSIRSESVHDIIPTLYDDWRKEGLL